MVVKLKPVYPALKHGCYSALTLLPGEDPKAFEKLHREAIAEHCPNGALEEHLVGDIARLTWRQQNLWTIRKCELVQQKAREISDRIFSENNEHTVYQSDTDPKVQAECRNVLGDDIVFVEIGEEGTSEGLAKALDLHERLSRAIERRIKMLLLVRGAKSMALSTSERSPRLIANSSVARESR